MYQAVFLENEYLRPMILPQIGGRRHEDLDKDQRLSLHLPPTRDQASADRLVRIVDLGRCRIQLAPASPAIDLYAGEPPDQSASGWQCHRLARYPDPIGRLKGMVGICLYPGRAFPEMKAQLHNRKGIQCSGSAMVRVTI